MPHPRKEVMDGCDYQHRPITILHVGSMDFGADEPAGGVGHDTMFATPSLRWGRLLTFLPAIPRVAACHARGQAPPRGPPLSVVLTDWLSITSADGLDSRPAASRACIVIAPSTEATLHRRVVRKIAWQHPPLTTHPGNLEQRIDDRHQRDLAGPSQRLGSRQARLENRPFGFGYVACVTQPLASILGTSDFCPHVVP